MKIICVLVVVSLLLMGCASSEVYETLGNAMIPVVGQQPQNIRLELPDDAAVSVCGSDGQYYAGQGYDVFLQTLSGGDLDATLRSVTGFGKEQLSLLHTKQDALDRYSCAWTAAGEAGDVIGRCAVLDDGVYHYCLVVTAAAETAGEFTEMINGIFSSFDVCDQ